MFPDAGGLRDTFRQMGDQLAGMGYVTLVPDIYYRAGEWAPFDLARPEVSGSAIGTTGYCLGGRLSLIAAGGLGRVVAAAASFHGGRLGVADDPSSPHLLADRITATVYVAGAVEDGSFTSEQAEMLDRALTSAGVEHTIEFYPAHHGFAVPDNGTYDSAADARHWAALQELYGARLYC